MLVADNILNVLEASPVEVGNPRQLGRQRGSAGMPGAARQPSPGQRSGHVLAKRVGLSLLAPFVLADGDPLEARIDIHKFFKSGPDQWMHWDHSPDFAFRRPGQNSYVIQNFAAWAEHLVDEQMSNLARPEAGEEA